MTEQLLQSLQPLAKKLNATNELIEIENLLNNKNKNTNIMSLLKGIFWLSSELGTVGAFRNSALKPWTVSFKLSTKNNVF